MFRLLIVSCVLAGFLTASGCGPAGKPTPDGLTPVSGIVMLDGKPLGGASVMFIPIQGSTTNTGAGGITDSSGKFTLTSNDGGAAGAVPGTYKVIVSCLVKGDGTPVIPTADESPMQLMISGAKEQVPDQYSNPLSSKLLATIDSSGKPVELNLTTK